MLRWGRQAAVVTLTISIQVDQTKSDLELAPPMSSRRGAWPGSSAMKQWLHERFLSPDSPGQEAVPDDYGSHVAIEARAGT